MLLSNGSWQRAGETWQEFFAREGQRLKLRKVMESAKEDEKQMSREQAAEKMRVHPMSLGPGKRGSMVFQVNEI